MASVLGGLDGQVGALATSGLSGWPLVRAAHQVVHRQFRDYTCLWWWESPAVAYERRRGYCAQYNGALAQLLCHLGIECSLVHAFRVQLTDVPDWQMGHVWVRVRCGEEVRDVCAGSADFDVTGFVPLTAVHPFGAAMQCLTTIGMAPIVLFALARAILGGRRRPDWLHHPLDP